MAHRPTTKAPVSRRHFIRDAATATAVVAVSPRLLAGCGVAPSLTGPASPHADALDQALEMMAGLAPLSNHGPMAAEALVALGRADHVIAWVEGYKKRFTSSYPAPRQAITREGWQAALGDGARVADWVAFFERELKEEGWPRVLTRWVAVLAPGMAAAAAHGVIRTAHAARSLSLRETEPRRRELAEGLGYWAAYYQPLPAANHAATSLRPADAVGQIPLLPDADRPRGGSIMAGLQGLDGFPQFAGVLALVEVESDAEGFLSELTEAFAAAYLRDASPRSFLALIHAVTGTAGLRSLLPYLSPAAAREVLQYGWQTAAALYSVFGAGSTRRPPEAETVGRDELIDRALATRDEHAIKFTEACLREHALNPKPVYLQAALDAIGRL
jgi:hypothetical protein